ncbi:MAG: hypothetical protein KF718_16230 [Polyangiaceae bacterium]|nr:hypothetical protein [Polyangiaceae bacterium]
MASKFSTFLQEHKIDTRRLLATSKRLERLTLEDRRLKARKKAGSESAPAEEGAKPRKPASGRPVTPRLVTAAEGGKPISGASKTRLLRAVNRILEQKKKDPIDLRALF